MSFSQIHSIYHSSIPQIINFSTYFPELLLKDICKYKRGHCYYWKLYLDMFFNKSSGIIAFFNKRSETIN